MTGTNHAHGLPVLHTILCVGLMAAQDMDKMTEQAVLFTIVICLKIPAAPPHLLPGCPGSDLQPA